MKKHISLDLWNTILISNREFSISRIKLLRDTFLKGYSQEQISKAIEAVGIRTDEVNMSTGSSIQSEDMYRQLLTSFGLKPSQVELELLYERLEVLFLKSAPRLMYPREELINWCNELRSNGHTLSISSNTAFIKGRTLRKALSLLGIDQFFEFMIFSDEIGYSKPAKEFFQCLLHQCSINGTCKSDIIHIGDSLEADVGGAKDNGIAYVHIPNGDLILTEVELN